MKRLALILLAATSIPAFAQVNDGYYRIQNAQSGNYVTLVDSTADKSSIISTSNVEAYALNTVNGFDNIVSDPGSIVYFKKDNQGYILKGQGVDTYTLTGGYYLQIPKSRSVENAYWASATYSGVSKYLYEAYNESFGFGYLTSASKNADGTTRNRDWYIIPVTQEEGRYFGLAPELKIGNKYYTTLYASFPYQLSEGMKAYYVKQHSLEGKLGPMAEIDEIENGIVPEALPVIIECSSNLPAKNKVTPLTTTVANKYQNELKGVYFCNVIRWASDGALYPQHKNWNPTAYNPSTMRVLGEVNGKLGLIKSDKLEFLPANKAYLQLEASGSTANSLLLLNAADYNTAGIENITADEIIKHKGIYTLTGIKVCEDLSEKSLPSGIYIVNGKKVFIQ
jgi:hypothetical protein